jgi:hypothetical protein
LVYCCFHSPEHAAYDARAENLARIACHALLFAAATAVAIGLTGCGSGNGFFGEAPASYTVTLTATSGTVQHSTTVTLNVQ